MKLKIGKGVAVTVIPDCMILKQHVDFHDVQNDSDTALDRRLDHWMRDATRRD